MKKLLVSIFVLTCLSCVLYSQEYQDVVYLKNGSIIRGVIIEQTPNVSLKIKTSENNVFVYKFEEIEKITKEVIDEDSNSGSLKKTTGSVFSLGIGLGVGITTGDIDGLGVGPQVNFSFGWLFSKNFGAGLAIDEVYFPDPDVSMTSIRAELIGGSLSKMNSMTFFGKFGGGYTIMSSEINAASSPDIYLGFGVGFKLSKKGKVALTFEPGYNIFTEGGGMVSLRVGIIGLY